MVRDMREGREFAVRSYRWGLEQWRQEVERNFPLPLSILSPIIFDQVAVLERWPRERHYSRTECPGRTTPAKEEAA